MGLTSRTKLDPTESQLPLGAGGMGEVYRARDAPDRTVAINMVPETFSSDSDRLRRFQDRCSRAL
jgi:serine/threonine protein kinase